MYDDAPGLTIAVVGNAVGSRQNLRKLFCKNGCTKRKAAKRHVWMTINLLVYWKDVWSEDELKEQSSILWLQFWETRPWNAAAPVWGKCWRWRRRCNIWVKKTSNGYMLRIYCTRTMGQHKIRPWNALLIAQIAPATCWIPAQCLTVYIPSSCADPFCHTVQCIFAIRRLRLGVPVHHDGSPFSGCLHYFWHYYLRLPVRIGLLNLFVIQLGRISMTNLLLFSKRVQYNY